MSKPRTIYQLIFENAEKQYDQYTEDPQTLTIDIYNNADLIDDSEDQTIISLTGSEAPAEFSIIDNDEDKFTPIRATQLIIRIESDENVNMATFATVGDWRVDAYYPSKYIFYGRLLLDENAVTEEFLPHPRIIELTANDGLGLLKDIPLVNSSGNNPSGYNSIISYLSWALAQTGLSLQINAVFNIREQDSYFSDSLSFVASTHTINYPSSHDSFFSVGKKIIITGSQRNDGTYTVASTGTGGITVTETVQDEINLSSSRINVGDGDYHFFKDIYLDAKTFEDQIGTSLSCYEVIKRILGEEAVLFQRSGAWWILRVDEVEDGHEYYVSEFNADGTFIQNKTDTIYRKSIGKDGYVIYFSEAATTVTIQVPYKSVKETFNFELPLEVPCNVDFSRGTRDTSLDGDGFEAYIPECWSLKRANYPDGPEIPATTDIFIKKVIQNGYEKERYVVIKAIGTVYSNFIMSEDIPVNYKDKFNIGMSRRLSADVGGSGFYRDNAVQIRLYGDDGTYWLLKGQTSVDSTMQWYASNADFTINNKYFVVEGDTSDDLTQSKSLYGSSESPEIPVGGKLRILIYQSGLFGNSKDTYIDSVSFEYIPYVNGSYQKYTSQYHQVTQATNPEYYRPKRDNQVYISDSPAKLFKGALFKASGSDYVLTELFYNAAVFPAGPPDSTYLHPFGEIQIWDVWNQFRNYCRVFQATCQGIDSASTDYDSKSNIISCLQKLTLADPTENTTGKYFLAISFDMDLKLVAWTGTLKEVFDTTISKHYDDTHEFKYV